MVNELLFVGEPGSAAAESYRTLWANVRFGSLSQPAHVILVTSASQDEGKAATAANLAVAAAQSGAEIILVDADLRRPSLHESFGVKNECGLTTALIGDAPLSSVVVKTAIERLRLLPGGPKPANPVAIMRASRLDEVLAELRGMAEFVLLDLPPISVAADASILAPRVDGVILTVDLGHSRRGPVRRAKEQLERVHARILGVALHHAAVDSDTRKY